MLKSIKEFAIYELQQLENVDVYACDLAYEITQSINYDCSVTYSTYDAIEWIKENFSELSEVVEACEWSYGEKICNPFHEPERFQVIIYIYVIERLLASCEFINENWNGVITLTKENIEILIEQIQNIYYLSDIL